jgi:hypothetical protein
MSDKVNGAGDRVVWENPMEMLDEIWLARQQRDDWRSIAAGLALAINTNIVVAAAPEHVQNAMRIFNDAMLKEY